jgi:hypothetical protein
MVRFGIKHIASCKPIQVEYDSLSTKRVLLVDVWMNQPTINFQLWFLYGDLVSDTLKTAANPSRIWRHFQQRGAILVDACIYQWSCMLTNHKLPRYLFAIIDCVEHSGTCSQSKSDSTSLSASKLTASNWNMVRKNTARNPIPVTCNRMQQIAKVTCLIQFKKL